MKKFALVAAMLAVFACNPTTKDPVNPDPIPEEPAVVVPTFAKGVDISWVTEMEKKNYKFSTSSGTEMECTALMKELGANAVRYRVWVNPSDGWCNKADVLLKAKRAQALGLAVMIDFHYSDSWADPSKQNPPAAWKNMDVDAMASALATHTKDVLQALKDAGVQVAWVQVGNETNTGMCLPVGSVSNNSVAGFVSLANAGYDAVKSVYPNALVITHHSNAQDLSANQWFYNLIINGGAKFDMIGLSLYPSYWDDIIKGYPDWRSACESAVTYFQRLYTYFSKPIMLVEFGMPASEPEKAKAAFQYVLDGVKSYNWFKGVFYWEPEAEHARNGYDYGAFANGKSTGVIDLYK